jgi:hypothetical protein
MSDITSVPRADPRAFETQFIEIHNALGMKETSNSGAYWGDGDGRPVAKGQPLEFGFEGKVRYKDSKLTPAAGEMDKAMLQLRKFSPHTLRLFGVYSDVENSYAISIPIADDAMLKEALGLETPGVGDPTDMEYEAVFGETLQIIHRRSEPDIPYMHYPWLHWKRLYNEIESFYA